MGNGHKEGYLLKTFEAIIPAFPSEPTLNCIGETHLHPDLEAFIRIGKKSMPDGSCGSVQSTDS
jgi:hypothetical protein